MDIEQSLPYVMNYFNSCDWADNDFSWEKAFISSVFSNLAYRHVSDFELENTNNVNLIPSSEYEKSIRSYLDTNTKINVNNTLREFNVDAESFVIDNQYVIASVIRIGEIVFVSLRGTELFNIYDWSLNLNSLKTSPFGSKESDVKLHRGFYRGVISFKEQLENAIIKRFSGDIKIYVTGHSLGGALAAILYGLWSRDHLWNMHSRYFHSENNINNVISAYTFGMPRYANLAAIAYFSNPYHVLNSKDLVPNVPPKAFGYDDCANNIPLNKSLVLNIKHTGFLKHLKKFGSFITLKKLEHHSVESYVERIHNEINNS